MKLAYQKPAYKHIALTEANGTSDCEYTHNYCWETCPIDIGAGFTVFTSGTMCTLPVSGEDAVAYICSYNGSPNSTVFGS